MTKIETLKNSAEALFGSDNPTISGEEYLELLEGQFMVFFPNDAHKPSISLKEISSVKKVVVKVKID